MADYLEELASLTTSSSEEFTLFETDKIKEDLEKDQSGVHVTAVTVDDPNTLRVALTFDSLESLLESQEAQAAKIIRFTELADGSKKVHIRLDRENYEHLDALFSEEQKIVMDIFGPKENEGLSEEEYLEMMSYALGEQGSDLLRASIIETRVKVKGTLLDQKGGVREGDTVVFRIPLLRFLLLDEILEYQLTFR
ncbi:MAG: hypothetical protein JW760_02215 [Spirochaetales bacterium]|nr:hypothetical protein [Spirochaetales bacterium]